MPRYIDADELRKEVPLWLDGCCLVMAVKSLDDAPTLDVQEVKHGKWIEETERIKSIAMMPTDITYYRCSECGRKEYKREPYCNCGARMDGDE